MTELITMATQPVDTQLRKTGIGVVGDVPCGTQFFMLYETKEELFNAPEVSHEQSP